METNKLHVSLKIEVMKQDHKNDPRYEGIDFYKLDRYVY